jgi:uncharacterized membrane protein (UPF0127 family)
MDEATNYLKESKIKFVLGLTVVIFIIILVSTFILQNNKSTQILVKGQNFNVELAQTSQEKQIGLSNTNSIAENEGMLFLFDEADYYSFWMRDMKFPIDIIFINGNKVTTIISNALPPSKTNGSLTTFQPKIKSDKVLEVNAGIAKKYNIQEGTIIDINNL